MKRHRIFRRPDGRYHSPPGEGTSRTKAIDKARSLLRKEGGGIVEVYDRISANGGSPDEEIRVFS